MIRFMMDGGPFTWAVLGLLLCGGFLTLLRVILARHVDFPGAGLHLAGLLLGVGLVGTFQGWRNVFEAVALAPAETKAEMIQAGVDLGWNPTTLALIGVVALAPLHGIALARSRDRATGVIKGLGWSSGLITGLVALLGWAVAIWFAGMLATVGVTGGGDASLEAMAAAKTVQLGLMGGFFLGLLAALLGLGGGSTLLVSGIVSGIRNRKKHLEEDEDEI